MKRHPCDCRANPSLSSVFTPTNIAIGAIALGAAWWFLGRKPTTPQIGSGVDPAGHAQMGDGAAAGGGSGTGAGAGAGGGTLEARQKYQAYIDATASQMNDPALTAQEREAARVLNVEYRGRLAAL